MEIRKLIGLKSHREEYSEFTLATNPHDCTFGKWLYQYESKEYAVNHLLNQIEEPYAKLHTAALEIERYKLYKDVDAKKKEIDYVFQQLFHC